MKTLKKAREKGTKEKRQRDQGYGRQSLFLLRQRVDTINKYVCS